MEDLEKIKNLNPSTLRIMASLEQNNFTRYILQIN